MASLTDLYKECQAVERTLRTSLLGNVKFNKSLCRLLTDKYTASLEELETNPFCEGDSIDLPCKTALVELRRIMSCGQLLVTQWTKNDWWTSVISSSDSASLEKKVILHLREFLACVDVLVQMKTNIMYPPVSVSLESAVKDASRRDIHSLIRSLKEVKRGILFTPKFSKLAKHLSEKLEAEISNHEHPYTIDFALDVEISYKDCLGGGSFGTVYKCTFLGVMAAAKVWKTNCMNKEAAEKEAHLSSKLRHPNVVQFIGYGVKENQRVIISELMSMDLRRYLDEKKENAGEGPPLPLLVAMNILIQIAEAMNYLHENGVMHRDLKANNVLINVVEGPGGQLSSSSVQVKLTDFGESKLKLHDSGYTTPMVGTTRWRAPEVFEVEENREKYTKSADVYSFSMLCVEVLTGDVPFKDKPLGTLLQSIREGVRPQLPDVDYCPDYLSALIEKCWATNAVKRPQFPVIWQLLMDFKARVLKHPCGQEDATRLLNERNLHKLVDLRLGSTYNVCQMQATISAAGLCVLQSSQHRPEISQVLKMLGKDSDGEEGLSTGGNSRPVYIGLQQMQSIYVQRPSPRRFSFMELQAATGSFSPRNFVGKGVFNKVYRGELQDGRVVAIKRPSIFEGNQPNFRGLEINSCLSHANIVSLIGYCVKNRQLILVYDFLHQQTLWGQLHGEENVLGWEVRYKVAVGICKALEYLHDGSPRSVIHRNVNPSNILLSHDFQPQLSSFVLATWAPKRPMYLEDNVVGTEGYLDPEYDIAGRFSDKSDVYSFGVVLLELITGRKVKVGTRPQGEQYLMAWARPLLDERNLDELVDPRLGNTYNVRQMQAMISAAALCVQESSYQRPKISEVLKMLMNSATQRRIQVFCAGMSCE